MGRSSSGPGTSGAATWWSTPSAGAWNEAIIDRIGRSCCRACTLRALKERPSRSRSTAKVMGSEESPARRK
ncbi:hypothetical protein WDZ16_13185 [Pseudokineococcus marinus]